MAMHDFRAHVIHSAVQPSCPPRGSFGAAIEWPELESRVARGEPPLQPRARAPAQSSRNVQLAYLLCHARSVACACWMDVARPGFEPRACRDTFEPSFFERPAARLSLCYVYGRMCLDLGAPGAGVVRRAVCVSWALLTIG